MFNLAFSPKITFSHVFTHVFTMLVKVWIDTFRRLFSLLLVNTIYYNYVHTRFQLFIYNRENDLFSLYIRVIVFGCVILEKVENVKTWINIRLNSLNFKISRNLSFSPILSEGENGENAVFSENKNQEGNK